MREWALRLLLVVLSLLLPLAAGELLLRALAPPADRGTLFAYPPDSERESFGIANARGYYAGSEVVLNSLGLREREVAAAPAPGSYRIVVLGDSMTFGQGAPQDQIWPRLLEQALQASRPAGRDRIEVINLGVPGYNTLQELAQWRELGQRLKPDLVVVGYFYNDVDLTPPQLARLYPAAASAASAAPAAADGGPLLSRTILALKGNSLLFGYLSPRIGAVLRRFGVKGIGQAANYNRLYGDGEPGWQQVRLALREMKSLVEASGAELFVVVMPAMISCAEATYPMQPYHDAVGGFLREQGIAHADLLTGLRHVDFSTMWVSATDGHPDAQGHRLLAEAAAGPLAAHIAGKASRSVDASSPTAPTAAAAAQPLR